MASSTLNITRQRSQKMAKMMVGIKCQSIRPLWTTELRESFGIFAPPDSSSTSSGTIGPSIVFGCIRGEL
jgi:hypothetical protein